MQLEKLKIKNVRKLDYTEPVYDISVENFNHYIDDKGIVHHNSGLYYSSSVVSFLSKAKLKTGEEDDMDLGSSGIKVTFKTEKNRLAKPKKVKFDISFTQGSNPYAGLEVFCRGEYFHDIGIAKGKWEEYPTPIEIVDKTTGEVTMKYGEFKEGGLKYYVRHLGKSIFEKQLYTPEVFTKEVLEKMDIYIKRYFKYGSLQEIEDLQSQYEHLEEEDVYGDDISASDLFE